MVRDERGLTVALIGVARDITEQKRAEAQREKLREAMLQARKLEAMGLPVFTLVLAPRGAGAALDAVLLRDGPTRFYTLELGRIEQDLAKLR